MTEIKIVRLLYPLFYNSFLISEELYFLRLELIHKKQEQVLLPIPVLVL